MTKIWAKTDIKRLFLPEGPKKGLGLGRSPPQELEEGPHSGPHLLVTFKRGIAAAGEPFPWKMRSLVNANSRSRDVGKIADLQFPSVAEYCPVGWTAVLLVQ